MAAAASDEVGKRDDDLRVYHTDDGAVGGAKMSGPVYPVFLCGGSGTRLWPVSRKSYPKQFSRFSGEVSLFQATARRFSGEGFAAPMVITARDFRFMVVEQMAAVEVAPAAVVIEPDPRNTAPAVIVAALMLEARTPGALMLVTPSDHVIADAAAFQDAVRGARASAEAGRIVTFGIEPDRAETGYGWLELEQALEPEKRRPVALRSFVEKPDAAHAAELLAGGRHLWNVGIFLFTTTTILAAFKVHAPEILAVARRAVARAEPDLSFTRLDPGAWAEMPDVSLDYAVMEKADNLDVMPFCGGWSDLGGWEAIWREGVPDKAGVVQHGPTTAIACSGSLLRAEAAGQHVVGIGLEDMIVVAMPDAVLVAPRARAQEVRLAVATMKAQGVPQAETLARDYRPWGWYESLANGNRFQVKRIVVQPGGILSLQSHIHRAEHWIVVEGTAQVTIGSEVSLVSENTSVYIPLGVKHRLENPGKMPLTLIEVQTGSYLGEDDIVRYEDRYARKENGAKG